MESLTAARSFINAIDQGFYLVIGILVFLVLKRVLKYTNRGFAHLGLFNEKEIPIPVEHSRKVNPPAKIEEKEVKKAKAKRGRSDRESINSHFIKELVDSQAMRHFETNVQDPQESSLQKTFSERIEEERELEIKNLEPVAFSPSNPPIPKRKRTISGTFKLEEAPKMLKEPNTPNKKTKITKSVTKICFTGGPSGGKTTAISTISGYLRDLGHVVICVPDAEKIVVSNLGAKGLAKSNKEIAGSRKIDLHINQLLLQLMLEDTFTNIIKQTQPNRDQELFLMIENGALDQKAYSTEEEWSSVLVETKINESLLLERYDMVLHMVTAADGAANHFNHLNNSEKTLKESRSLDEALRNAYIQHPNFYLVNNSSISCFSEKISLAKNYVLNKVFEYSSASVFHKKYLLKNNKGNVFDELVALFSSEIIEIEDIVLSYDGSVSKYVRKRVRLTILSLDSESNEHIR